MRYVIPYLVTQACVLIAAVCCVHRETKNLVGELSMFVLFNTHTATERCPPLGASGSLFATITISMVSQSLGMACRMLKVPPLTCTRRFTAVPIYRSNTLFYRHMQRAVTSSSSYSSTASTLSAGELGPKMNIKERSRSGSSMEAQMIEVTAS